MAKLFPIGGDDVGPAAHLWHLIMGEVAGRRRNEARVLASHEKSILKRQRDVI